MGFNKVFGYYIEISHAQAAQATIPEDYVRKQTLTNAERYITAELKDLETRILSAEERAKVDRLGGTRALSGSPPDRSRQLWNNMDA